MNKKLYIVFLFKNAVFDWVNFKLHEFLNKIIKKKNENKELIFDNYKKFKEKLWQVFEIIDKKQAAEQHIYILWQNKSAVKYSIKF